MRRKRKTPSQAPILSAENLRQVERRGISHFGLRDFYHTLMTLPLGQFLLVLAGAFIVVNFIFAIGFMLTGGLGGVAHGGFGDAFFFSIETLSTTGYGAIYPISIAANLLASTEILFGLLGTALATGMLFARLSRPQARILFSKSVVVTQYRGETMMMFRVANERRNQIAEARITATVTVDEDDGAGGVLRRLVPLKLERDTSPVFALTWLVMHKITPDSPVYGKDAASIGDAGNVIICSLTGTDDTLHAAIHARHIYGAEDIRFEHRFVDVIERGPDGGLLIDYRRFHDTIVE